MLAVYKLDTLQTFFENNFAVPISTTLLRKNAVFFQARKF